MCRHQAPQPANNTQLADILAPTATSAEAGALGLTRSSAVEAASSSGSSCVEATHAYSAECGATPPAAEGAEKGDPTSMVEKDGTLTLWFPQGGIYARLPVQLPAIGPSQGVEEAVEFEVGALHG